MSDASPPVWIRRLSKQDSGLDAAHKFLLITLWAWGPYASKRGTEHDRPDLDKEVIPTGPVGIHPCRETLERETGQPLGTIKSQLAKLKATGWIKRGRGTNMTLAWRWPRNFDASRPTAQPARLTHQPADTPAPPADTPSGPADTPAAARLTHQPQTLQLTSNELPIKLPVLVKIEPEPLALIPPEHIVTVDHAADLRAEHDRLRREALRSHGRKATALPKPGTAAGRSLDKRIRDALAAYGLETCQAVLESTAAEWRANADQLAWSRQQAWSPGSVERSISRLDTGPVVGRRRGPGVEAAPNPREPAGGDTELSTDPDPGDEPPAWGDDFFVHARRVVVVNGS